MLTEIPQADKEKIPDGTLNGQKEMKNSKTDKYLSKYKQTLIKYLIF